MFLYRREPRELAEKLGVDCSKMDGPTVPVVYSVSFADPAGYFLATRVQMHNKDVIFAANAQSVEIEKFAHLPQRADQRAEQRRGAGHQCRGVADRQPHSLDEPALT